MRILEKICKHNKRGCVAEALTTTKMEANSSHPSYAPDVKYANQLSGKAASSGGIARHHLSSAAYESYTKHFIVDHQSTLYEVLFTSQCAPKMNSRNNGR